MFSWGTSWTDANTAKQKTKPVEEAPRDYQTAIEQARTKFQELQSVVGDLKKEIAAERTNLEYYKKTEDSTSSDLKELQISIREVETQRDSLKLKRDELQAESDGLCETLQKNIQERDQCRMETQEMEDEAGKLEFELTSHQSEMEQVRIFGRMNFNMIDNLKMNNQTLLMEKEQMVLDMRKLHVEVEQLKLDLVSNKVLRDHTKVTFNEAKELRAEMKRKAQMRATQNDELHNEYESGKDTVKEGSRISRNRRLPSFQSKLHVNGNGQKSIRSVSMVSISEQPKRIARNLKKTFTTSDI